jgi:hypothetical protein
MANPMFSQPSSDCLVLGNKDGLPPLQVIKALFLIIKHYCSKVYWHTMV